MSHNPQYSQASGAYRTTTSAAADQRTLEGQALLNAAQRLETLSKSLKDNKNIPLEEIEAPLTYNRKLWELFLDNVRSPEHLLPLEIKNNVASLAVFVFKRTIETLVDPAPEKLQVLIDINRNIAAGLLKPIPQQAANNAAQAAPVRESLSTDSVA